MCVLLIHVSKQQLLIDYRVMLDYPLLYILNDTISYG